MIIKIKKLKNDGLDKHLTHVPDTLPENMQGK
jgi:hypothetical protein